jgi:hypothetical protein
MIFVDAPHPAIPAKADKGRLTTGWSGPFDDQRKVFR